uniref:Uncharacterized protein n=1 Tax=Anguilla anguilla TaxID=7936 RepID=A0A0E9TXL8_ANGAN
MLLRSAGLLATAGAGVPQNC